MRDEENWNISSASLQEFTDQAIEVPPEARLRIQHLPARAQRFSWTWWWVTAGAVLIALLLGWLLGHGSW
jgi:hypothetical protein